MPIRADGPAPYAPAPAVIQVLDGYRDRGLTTPFNASVLERAGVPPSLAPRTLHSLRDLDLIDEEGNPTDSMKALSTAGSEEYPQRLAAHLRSVYEEVFQFTEPRDDPPSKVRDAFRVYTPRGQQTRMVTLFLGLCAAAGLVDEAPPQRRTGSRQGQTAQAQSGRGSSGKAVKRPAAPPPAAPDEMVPSPAPQTGQHPFIRGLIQTLPEVGTEWPIADRKKWANAALAAFDVIYEPAPQDREGGE
jgi:hypothetical protein